jgi:outer membrane protein assembly factor BamB
VRIEGGRLFWGRGLKAGSYTAAATAAFAAAARYNHAGMGRRRAIWLALAVLVLFATAAAGLLRAVSYGGGLRESWHVRIPDTAVGSMSTPADWALLGQDAIIAGGQFGTLRVYGFDGQRRFIFSSPAGACIASYCVAPDGGLYICTSDSCLYSIAPDFTQRWVTKLADDIDGTLSLVVGRNGTVYVLADAGQVYAISPGGALRWRVIVSNWNHLGRPLLQPDDSIVCLTHQQELISISSQGAVRWRTTLGVLGIETATQAGSLILCPNRMTGRLCAVGPHGDVIYSLNLPSGALQSISPLLAARPDGGCYFISQQPGAGSELVSVDAGGLVLWRKKLEHAAFSPVLLPDGRVACLEVPEVDRQNAGSRTTFISELVDKLTGSLDARLRVFNPDGTPSVSGPANCMFALTQLLVSPAGEILLLDERGTLRAFKP